MTLDEVTALLRLRAQLCSQPYSHDTADAWHEVLEPADATKARQALHDLVRAGTTKVTLGAICERAFPQGGSRTTEPTADDDDEPPVSPERARWWINEIRRQQAERQAIRESTCPPTAAT